MKKISAKKLPPIFKMSVLWNILPYYGHLHRWRRLLEKINTKTKDIWDRNREQLKYIGRDFKRDIELDKLKQSRRRLRPKRNWLDLFSLSLSYYFDSYFSNTNFDITNLTDNLTEDEVIIIDSHDNVFNFFKIHFWRKDRILDILPAIKCPSFKSETKIFKTSEMFEIGKFINDQDYTKSVVIENMNEKLSIKLVYGNTVKIKLMTFSPFQQNKFFNKLKERYELWEIGDCACKPKKIRIWLDNFEKLKYAIEKLERFSDIIDAKLGVYINSVNYKRSFSKYDTISFNNSSKRMSDKDTNFIFTGDTLAVVYDGKYYNFRLDEGRKESECSKLRGKI